MLSTINDVFSMKIFINLLSSFNKYHDAHLKSVGSFRLACCQKKKNTF